MKKEYMKNIPTKKNLDARTTQIRNVYMSCMNEPERAKSERGLVSEFQLAVEKIKTGAELLRFSNQKVQMGLGPLLGLGSTPNLDNPKIVDAYVGSDLMLLPDHKYYQNQELLNDLEKNIFSFLKILDPKAADDNLKARAAELIKMQLVYITTYPVPSIRRDRWSEKRISTQKDLKAKYPKLSLDTLFKAAPKKTLVNTPIPEALEYLNSNIEVLPVQTWKDFYLYKTLSRQLDDAYPEYFQAQFNFTKKYFGGPQVRPERQERCTNFSTSLFMKEFDAALVDEFFPNFVETKVHNLIENIRQSILVGLKKNQWLSEKGKAGAEEKIRTARLQLIKPHTAKEWDFLPTSKYSETNHIKNIKTYNQAVWKKTIQELHEPTNMDAWGMGPLTINAYYSASENKFVLPIGIMQFPFYDKDGLTVENLGAVGAVAGHELGHGIDDQGSKYNAKGQLLNWLPEEDLKQLQDRGQKLVQQFSEIGHDGKLTLGENVADLVGLTFAYQAAFPEESKANDEQTEAAKQKFFVSYGRLWCSVVRPDFAQLLLKTDPHASGKARINEQVKHQPGFAEAFHCKAGDKMYLPAEQRVQIW